MSCSFCTKHLPSLSSCSHVFETCPFRLSISCPKCCLKGHLASDCMMVIAWERPKYLEDLIPDEVKLRWSITTKTPIIHTPLRKSHDVTVGNKEIPMSDTYKIVKHDKKIRTFMKENAIHSTHEQIENMRIITDWAIKKGMRVEFIKESILTQ